MYVMWKEVSSKVSDRKRIESSIGGRRGGGGVKLIMMMLHNFDMCIFEPAAAHVIVCTQ